MVGDPCNYHAEEILRDGGSIRIRAIRPDDKERLLEHFHSLGPRSVYYRFHGVKKRLTEAELSHFTDLDFVHAVGLAATLDEHGREVIVGVGRYFTRTDQGAPERAEVAFAVLDRHQGRGIGSLLLEHLARIARAAGITELEAEVLGENNRMLEVFAKSGFEVRRSIAGGVFHVTFPTRETVAATVASHARERHAKAESMRAILAPRSVAVVGASRHPGTIGATLVANLTAAGFQGSIYPVNPHATAIAGLSAHPTVADIGAPIDLALIAVPAAQVEDVIADCARAGVRSMVVISAGFAEASAEGAAAERRLRERARAAGMRLVGPNCLGVLNTDPTVRLNASFAPRFPPAGNVAIVSQSGALGIAVLEMGESHGLGVSSFVAIGNRADVSSNDVLAYCAEDPHTAVVALYLESFGNPRTFAWLAPEVARVKPIVAVKSGRSSSGRRAAASHSAALATVDVAVDALFEQAGVIRTDTLEGLFDVAALLSAQPLPAGPRVGVVTNAGGPGILFADACEARSLELPELAAATQARLAAFLPPHAGLRNPVDVIASATAEQIARAVEIVGGDPDIDAVVVICIPLLSASPDDVAAAIARGAGTVPDAKPVLSVFMARDGAPAALHAGPRGRIPAYLFPENAAYALAAAERYGRWKRRPTGTAHVLPPFAAVAVRAVVDRALRDGGGWLDVGDVATILRAVGIRVVDAEVTPVADVAAAADRLGYPLVAKAIAPSVLHKSEVGGVILGLQSAAEVEEAARTLATRMADAGTALDGVLLQREVAGGIEVLVGVAADPIFGPLIACGSGGILAELVHDVVFHLPPVTDVDAEEMIDKLRAGRLLAGHRGAPGGDRQALVDCLVRVSALVESIPEIQELDLNPMKLLPPGQGAVVVDARMRIAPRA